MEVTHITLARAIYIFELAGLNPRGRKTSAESNGLLQTRYNFVSFPTNGAEVTLQKGAEFLAGRMGDIAIEKVTLFSNGIMVDTRSSTEDSEKVLLDILQAAHEELGANVVVTRKHYASQFVFKSTMNYEKLNPVLTKIARIISAELSRDLHQTFVVAPSSIKISIDQTLAQVSPAIFAVERREEVPFSQNTYFASAPVGTNLHMSLVEEFEKSLL